MNLPHNSAMAINIRLILQPENSTLLAEQRLSDKTGTCIGLRNVLDARVFSGSEVVRYDVPRNRISALEAPISQGRPGLNLEHPSYHSAYNC